MKKIITTKHIHTYILKIECTLLIHCSVVPFGDLFV